ncbi:MAG: hypothetical protein SEPTF4163_004770 [Sporothrix epigloea]
MNHSQHTHTPTPQTASASAATPTIRRRNSSTASTASSCPSVEQCPAATPPSFRQDPLAALERALLAHPTTHRYWHRRRHSHDGNHLVPPSPAHHTRSPGRSHDQSSPSPPRRSPSHSPLPSSAARRCMEATDAWTPSLDRRQSWDGQAHRRAMMIQSTGLGCTCHPEQEEDAGHDCNHGPDQSTSGSHHHRRLTQPFLHMVTPQNIYESDRGFSEVQGSSH